MRGPDLESYEARWFLEFYRSRQGPEHALPSKRALAPEALLPVLGHVFILEALSNGFFFLLFGTEIATVVGRDNTGRYMHDTLDGEDLKQMSSLLSRCLTMPVIIATKERILHPGREWIEVEIIRCPFTDEAGHPRFIAGTFAKIGSLDEFTGSKVISKKDIGIHPTTE